MPVAQPGLTIFANKFGIKNHTAVRFVFKAILSAKFFNPHVDRQADTGLIRCIQGNFDTN